jgi:hypothetical protein
MSNPLPVNVPLFEGVFNIDQSPYNNIVSNVVTPVAVVPIAVVSNIINLDIDNENTGDVVINLEPINLTFEDFITLFYYNTGYKFGISTANSLKNPVTFLNKFYNTTPNEKSIFSLYDQFIKAWTKKTNRASSTLSFVKLIKLQREVFLLKGLSDLGIFTIGQSYDEILSYLLATSNVKPVKHNCHNEYVNGVPVEFVVQSKIYSPELDVILYVNFRYIVVIPGFTTGDIITEVLPKKLNKDKIKERNFLYECSDNSSLNSDDLPPSLPSHLVSSNNSKHEFSIVNMDKSVDPDNQTIFDDVSRICDDSVTKW